MKHFIFGGRYGDICHSLPAVYEYAMRTGTKPRFTAAAEFASILDGCSYLEPHAAPVPWQKINDIVRYAQNAYPKDEIVNMACYGHDYSPGYHSWSYLRDSWRLSQCPLPPERVPLIFDKRNPAAEKNVISNCLRSPGAPYVLISTQGKSSPFPNQNMLIADVRAAMPGHEIVDISQTRAPRVFDLIGIMEKAAALVTIDTLHLHLSSAVPNLPVFALITDGPSRWNRSCWRPQQYWRATYREYPNLRFEFRESLKAMTNTTPKIHHVWAHIGPRSEETKRRMAVAQASWQAEAQWAGNWTFTEVTADMLTRTHEDCGLPYVHDLIDTAIGAEADEGDVISLSNSDVGCVQGITGQVLDGIREHGCCFTHRHDMHGGRIEKPIQMEAEVGERCKWYPGSDWFFMSVKWWRRNRHEFPDMVIGREFWDCVLRQVMKKRGTHEIHKAVWHEKHASMWEQPGLRNTLAGNLHNRRLAMQFFAENRSNDQDPFRSTWNMQPGVTQRIDPNNTSMRDQKAGVMRPRNVIFPARLEFHQNTVRRIMR